MAEKDEGAQSAQDLRISELQLGEDRLLVISFPSGSQDLPEDLTPAEAEVARLLLKGLSNQEIADQRGVSARTIANQLAAIYRKTEVSTRAEFALKAAGSLEEGSDS